MPYRDFLWVQTPLSLYLHTAWFLLPDGWQLQAGRLAFYLELAAVSAIPAVWATRSGILPRGARSAAVVAMTTALAIHNFPPMPWPTVDGLFLASAGLTAFLASCAGGARRRVSLRAAAAVLFALAALSRQPFALFAALLVVVSLLEPVRVGRRAPLVVAAALPGAAVVGAVALLAAASGSLDPMLAALRGSSGLVALIDGGLVAYARPAALIPAYVALAAVGYVCAGAVAAQARPGRLGWEPLLLGVVVALAAALNTPFVFLVGVGVVYLLVGAFLARLRRDRGYLGTAAGRLHAGAILLAWAASISYGYQTPLLGIGPSGIVLATLVPAADRLPARAVALLAALVVAAVVVLDLGAPYRDRPRAELVADLGDLYPRFGRLLTNRPNYERFAELRELTATLARGRPFVVLPDYPLIYYLSGSRNPASVDWFEPAVVQDHERRLGEQIAAADAIVFVEREQPLGVGRATDTRSCAELRAAFPFEREVLASWRLLREGTYFCAYRRP